MKDLNVKSYGSERLHGCRDLWNVYLDSENHGVIDLDSENYNGHRYILTYVFLFVFFSYITFIIMVFNNLSLLVRIKVHIYLRLFVIEKTMGMQWLICALLILITRYFVDRSAKI